MAEQDLATVKDLLSYLEPTVFASSGAEALTGGFGNYVFRIRLRQPYEDRQTLVVKHGKPYIPGRRTFAFSLDRQKFDVAAMRDVRQALPVESLVTTPKVHLHDEIANVIIMDDCGADAVILKDIVLAGGLSVSTAHAIGSALGEFLARLHAWGKDEEIKAFFEGNTQARTISAWATYGRLVDSLSGETRPKALQEPPLDVGEERLAVLREIADETADVIRTAKETLLHGDFWPGNVMLRLKGEGENVEVERLFVLDWELSKPGRPGFDIGQFCAELHQARRFYPSARVAASALLDALLGEYRRHRSDEDMSAVAKVAQTQFGVHLAVWTPGNSTWADKEIVREVVLEGVENLLDTRKGDLHRSVFAPLLA